jgi:hypothetical protein
LTLANSIPDSDLVFSGVITIFGVEKAVFQREYSSGMYGLPAYFISRNAVEVTD